MHLFAFLGDEELQRDLSLERAVAEWLGNLDDTRFAKEVFYAPEAGAEDILASYGTVPMFSSRRALVLKNVDSFPAASQAALAKGLATPVEESRVFFSGTKLDGRSKLGALVRKRGVVADFPTPYSNKIPAWLVKWAADRYGRTLLFADARYLWECVGDHPGELDQELKKLDEYLPKGAPIGLEHIEELVGRHRDISVFEFQKGMGLRHPQMALGALHDLLERGEPGFLLAHRLFKHFLSLLKVKTLERKGTPPAEIPRVLSMNSYIFQREEYLRQAAARSRREFVDGLVHLAHLESDMKFGKFNTTAEAELAFAKILSEDSNGPST